MARIPNQIISDMADAALYGTAYWAENLEVIGHNADAQFPGDALAAGAVWNFHDMESDRQVSLTKDKFKNGIEMAAKHFGLSVPAFYEGHDSEDADVAVQFGIFGKIIYG